MTALEENGGGDGNSSVAELEVRVETLEETVADHESRINGMYGIIYCAGKDVMCDGKLYTIYFVRFGRNCR